MEQTARDPNVPRANTRIVRAAITVFSRQGYHGTTARDIARIAGVSEVTLYRYFTSKEEIFWAALNASLLNVQSRFETLGTRWTGRQLAVVLPEMMRALMDLVEFSPETMRLVAVALLEWGSRARDICTKQLKGLYVPVHRYLSSTLDLSQLSNIDPAVLTATIMVSIAIHSELAPLTDPSGSGAVSARGAAESYANFWLHVLGPVENAVHPSTNLN